MKVSEGINLYWKASKGGSKDIASTLLSSKSTNSLALQVSKALFETCYSIDFSGTHTFARLLTGNRQKISCGELKFQSKSPLSRRDPQRKITYIVVFFVGLVSSFRISNLFLKIVVVLSLKFLNTLPITPLSISINIHLNNSVGESSTNVSFNSIRPTWESQILGHTPKHASRFIPQSTVHDPTLPAWNLQLCRKCWIVCY